MRKRMGRIVGTERRAVKIATITLYSCHKADTPSSMVPIICLIIGILGFVKKRISVTKTRELRGGPMYIAATLFCLPLPLGFAVGFAIGASAAASRTPVDKDTVNIASLICTVLPIVVAVIIAFAMAKPKEIAAPPLG